MSLLLDALKKSEAQRRRGEIPRFESGASLEHDRSEMRAPRRWLLFLMLVLVLAAGAAAWWLAPSMPDEVSESIEVAGGEPTDNPTMAGAGDAVEASALVAGSESLPEAAVATASPEPAPGAPDRSQSGQSATPPEQVADADRSVPADQALSKNASASARPHAGDDIPGAGEVGQSGVSNPESGAKPGHGPEPESEAEANDWIRPWELPQAERARFPELRLSVHFYAPRAEDRFVLINGEQYRQGDRIEDVRIAEIRRRGVVLDFERYRILLE